MLPRFAALCAGRHLRRCLFCPLVQRLGTVGGPEPTRSLVELVFEAAKGDAHTAAPAHGVYPRDGDHDLLRLIPRALGTGQRGRGVGDVLARDGGDQALVDADAGERQRAA